MGIDERLEIILIKPGKPWQNGTNKNFKGKFRDECLEIQWFRDRFKAKVIIEGRRRHYKWTDCIRV